MSTSVLAEALVLRAQPDVTLLKEGSVTRHAKTLDGGLLIAGDFQYFQGVQVNGLVRLDASGQLDADWRPANVDSIVAMTGSADGNVYITVATPAWSLIRIGPDGRVDPDWMVDMAPGVADMAIDGQGRLVVGGSFHSIGGRPVRGLAVIDPDTGQLAPGWVSWDGYEITAMASGPSGSIHVAYSKDPEGDGETTFGLARLLADGSREPVWSPTLDAPVSGMAVAPDGQVLAAGPFSRVNGVPRARLARLSGVGAGEVDAAWNPTWSWADWSYAVRSIDVDADGAVYLSGTFRDIAGSPQVGLAKLKAHGAGALDPDWTPPQVFNDDAADLGIRVVSVHAGQIQVSGEFRSQVPGAAVVSAVRLDRLDGTLISAQQPSVSGDVGTLLHHSNGSTFVSGYFHEADGLPRRNIVRLDANHQVDPAWNPDIAGIVSVMKDDGLGGILIGGNFDVPDRDGYQRLARLGADGTGALDENWMARVEGDGVSSIEIDADGLVYVGGAFSSIGGESQARLARVRRLDGGLDTTWRPVSGSRVSAAVLDGRGYLYAARPDGFSSRYGVWRYATAGDGQVDAGWSAWTEEEPFALRFDAAGNLLSVGVHHFWLQSRGMVALYPTSASGVVHALWRGIAGHVAYDALISPSGDIYAAGDFGPQGGLVRFQPHQGLDPDFPVVITGVATSLEWGDNDALMVGGLFREAQSRRRHGLASFELRGDLVFADGFDQLRACIETITDRRCTAN